MAEWQRAHSNRGACISTGLGLESANTHGEQQGNINQMGASKSSFQNSVDPLGFLLINTTVTLET